MIICSPELGISPESNLGGEVYDREILKGLDNLGVQTVIILPLGKKLPDFRNASLYFLPLPFVYPPWLFNLLILPYLFFLYAKFRFDIFRVHSPYYVGPAALLFGLFFPKVKIIPSYLHLEPENKFYDLLDRLLLKRYKKITTISESTKSELISKYGVDSQKVSVVPCGVEEKYRPLPKNEALLKKLGIDNRHVLLYLGQLIKRKNIPFLLDVLQNLPEEYALVLCGDGPEKENLERICRDMKLDQNVIFAGRIPENEKVEYYNLADIFLYPSLKEGFGLSVNEALACGKKVIASDLLVFREIKSSGLALLSLDAKLWVKEIRSGKGRLVTRRQNYYWSSASERYLEAIS